MIDNIKKVELEITSNCNAACPGCARTLNPDILKIESFSLADLKRIFPTSKHIKGKQFKFCGVLGDPLANREFLSMVEYLVAHEGYCQVSTNGGLQSPKVWSDLGSLSRETNLVDVSFCVDGHRETNHIYRVNTIFSVIEKNIDAYTSAGGQGSWIYIVFDHNEHELPVAKSHASRVGLKFATRTGMRNSYHTWTAQLRKQGAVSITTTGEKEHSQKAKVLELDKFINSYRPNSLEMMIDTQQEILSSIKCKWIHEGEIFIASDQTLWPCCFLWDSYFKNKENIKNKLDEYSSGWNSLLNHSIEEILEHPWYKEVLELSWNPEHNKHLTRCIRTCAYNKAYQNEIKYV